MPKSRILLCSLARPTPAARDWLIVRVWLLINGCSPAASVPDSLVLQVLEERLSRLDCSCRGWILHGFPRDVQQATSLQESQLQPNRCDNDTTTLITPLH